MARLVKASLTYTLGWILFVCSWGGGYVNRQILVLLKQCHRGDDQNEPICES